MDLSIVKNMKTVSNGKNKHDYNIIRVMAINKQNLEKEFEGSIAEAHRWLTKNHKIKSFMPKSTLFKCAAGYYPVAQSYYWEFANKEDRQKYNIYFSDKAANDFLSKKEMREQIVMFSRNGDPIKGFENILEALKFLKFEENKKPDYRTIISLAKRNSDSFEGKKGAETAFGYQWKFYKDAI